MHGMYSDVFRCKVSIRDVGITSDVADMPDAWDVSYMLDTLSQTTGTREGHDFSAGDMSRKEMIALYI